MELLEVVPRGGPQGRGQQARTWHTRIHHLRVFLVVANFIQVDLKAEKGMGGRRGAGGRLSRHNLHHLHGGGSNRRHPWPSSAAHFPQV